MTQKSSLEVLKQRSAAALRQKDLVGLAVSLARTKSPTKAHSTALAHGWPERQAKAVRSLAMLFRDYGLEAFNAFVSTFEHARSLVGETEQALEQKMNRERILSSVSRLTDPAAKLRLLIKHQLLDDAQALVQELLSHGEVSFWYSTNSATTPTRLLHDSTPQPYDGRDTVHVLVSETGITPPGGEKNPIGPGRDEAPSLTVTLDDLALALNWSEEQLCQFVRQSLEHIAVRDQVYRHHDCINATAAVRVRVPRFQHR